jgi:broad specificity phosphatase PhoE/predicted kinase
MVGLPARGKSTVAMRLKENMAADGIKVRVFNNGKLRRQMIPKNTSYADFFHPENPEGAVLRQKIAVINIERAKRFLGGQGQVAVLDATNVSKDRRDQIRSELDDHPILFIECTNQDEEILQASILRKIDLPEFDHLEWAHAVSSFKQRIRYYEAARAPMSDEPNYVILDSLYNRLTAEKTTDPIPHYDRIRDILATDRVKNLFLVRHGHTYFNVENRIGGNSRLTPTGEDQAERLAEYFHKRHVPVIFTSEKVRTIQTARPIQKSQRQNCHIIPLKEFNEIDAGVCEEMTYQEIRSQMPEVHYARKKDKYGYVYPEGESYATMKNRVDRGIKKALYLSGNANNFMIVGHQAVNRMILSHFLYRRNEDVPYIFVPQHKYYHIVALQDKKLFQLKKF